MGKLLLSSLFLIAMLQFVACDKGDDPPAQTEAQKVTALLIGSGGSGSQWSLSSVFVDEVDYTEVFQGFTMTFSETGVTTTNGTVVFESTDGWNFKDEATATQIVTDSGLELTIDELTENQLIFSFEFDETIYGRTSAVGGINVFTLNRP